MAEYVISIGVDDLADPRPRHLDDLHLALHGQPGLIAPSVKGDAATGVLTAVMTVEASNEADAQDYAFLLLRRALVATKRTASVARVLPLGAG